MEYDNKSIDYFKGDSKFYANVAIKFLKHEHTAKDFKNMRVKGVTVFELLNFIFKYSLQHRQLLSVSGICCPASYLTYIASVSSKHKEGAADGFNCEFYKRCFDTKERVMLVRSIYDHLFDITFALDTGQEVCLNKGDLPMFEENDLIEQSSTKARHAIYDRYKSNYFTDDEYGNKKSEEYFRAYSEESLDALKDKNQGVYLLYNDDKKLLYIGKSINLMGRIISSARERKATLFRFIYLESKADIHIIEPYLVTLLRPELNSEFNKDSDRPSFTIPIELNYSPFFNIMKEKTK